MKVKFRIIWIVSITLITILLIVIMRGWQYRIHTAQSEQPASTEEAHTPSSAESIHSPPESIPQANPYIRTEELEDGVVRKTFTQPETIFSKAFWRRPAPNDNILHAERIEWVDASGNVLKWQWFIIADPAAETRQWLAENPFSLLPAPAEKVYSDNEYHPAWFPSEFHNHTILASPDGSHWIATSADGQRIYATDTGSGFSPSITP